MEKFTFRLKLLTSFNEFFKIVSPRENSVIKSMAFISFLLILNFISIDNCLEFLLKSKFYNNLSANLFYNLLIYCFIFVFNGITLYRKNRAEEAIKVRRNLSERKKRIYNIVTILYVIFTISLVIFSFNLDQLHEQ